MIVTQPDVSDDPRPAPVLLGLRGLSGAITAMGNLTVTVDGVPDAARLSAGQFLGDGSWSVTAHDLDGLALHPSPGRNRNCRLSIRIRKIDKDMGDAFSVGAVYVDVDADSGSAAIVGTDGAISLKRKGVHEGQADPGTENVAVHSQPASESAPEKKGKAQLVKRIARLTGAAAPDSVDDSLRLPLDGLDGGLHDAPSLPPIALEPAVPENAAPEDELPWPSSEDDIPRPSSTEDESPDSGFDSPPALHDLAVPVPAAPDTSVDRAPEPVSPGRYPTVIPVRVEPGLRIGRFGKTGRPEDVVAVRGRAASQPAPRSERSGSIVFVRSA